MLNTGIDYKDISDQINLTGKAGFDATAYVEGGSVVVMLSVPAGTNGLHTVSINVAYAPRTRITGIVSGMATSKDAGKFLGAEINQNGKINILFSEALIGTDRVSFVYPLKRTVD